VLYKLDRRMSTKIADLPHRLPLTGWQSYGRPEVLALNKLIEKSACAASSTAVVLPCARKRPYAKIKTHDRIWRALEGQSVERSKVDSLVVSSIGIVPEALWQHPVVLAYDSGVPDIYRILRLMRIYFRKARYSLVINCLEFKPYSDCLQIIAREGIVGSVRSGRCGRTKTLPEP
jgi:predicted RNA-binding protein